MRQIILLLLSLLASSIYLHAQVSIGTEIPRENLHVHDSIHTNKILISHGPLTDQGLFLEKHTTPLSSIYNTAGDLRLKSGALSSGGAEMRLFNNGNVGIGKSLLASQVTHELSIFGSNPLRLVGLNELPDLDTVLVKNKDGVVYERPFTKLFQENSYWTSANNKLFNITDSVGIGTSEPIAPFQISNAEQLNVILSSEDERSEFHIQAAGVESVIGQYGPTTTASFLGGSLPADGLAYWQGNFESISGNQNEGILVNVINDKAIYFGTADQERLRINGNGQVSIRNYNSSSQGLLNVEGSSYIRDSLMLADRDYHISVKEDTMNFISDKDIRFQANRIGDFLFQNRDSTFVTFDGSRATVGIGVQNPIEELEVAGDVIVQDTLYFANRFNKIYAGANMYVRPLTNLRLETRPTYDVEILSGNTEYATFEAENMRFGVGTNTPEEKVDVIGVVKAEQFKMVASPSEGHVMTSDENGLAIWQAVPDDEDWDVIGSDLFTSASGTVTIGSSGLPSSKLNVQGSMALPIVTSALASYSPTANDYTVVMTSPSSSITLPDPATCKGRLYVLKFIGLGNSIQAAVGNIEGMPSYPVPTSPIGLMTTTMVVQSDGGSTWWIINY